MEHGLPTASDHILATEAAIDRYRYDCVWDRIWIARNQDGVERSNEGRGFIQQDKEELWELMGHLRALKPQKILEIGNACGGTTLVWQALAPEVYSLDIQPPEGHIPEDYFPNVTFIVGDTHKQETLEKAKAFAPYDFLFIDGDHCTEGVKQDYEMYSPLVRAGGIVGFHDYNFDQVRTFLKTLPNLELMPTDRFGIALLRKEKVVTYLCMIVADRLATMSENITAALPFVDEVIVVDGGSTDGTLEWLAEHPSIHVINFPWRDDFAASRNQYLQKIAELRVSNETSIYVRVDDDEFFSEPVLQKLKPLMKAAAGMEADQVRVRVRDVVLGREGNTITAEIGDFRKPLLHTWKEGMHYEGVVHEALITPGGARQIDLDDSDGRFLYEHRKREQVWWPRGLRNFFLAGGGVPPQADRQQLWLEFKNLIARHGTFKTYRDFEAYLAQGNIAQEIKDWFIKQRLLGLPSYDAKFTEIREGFLTYFIWYHPEELPSELIAQDKDYMDYPAEIKRIHG